MANVVLNTAKGMIGYYAGLPVTNDAIIAVPIETTGIVSDATMIDYDTLADLLAGASNEQTTLGRKTLASVTSTVDDTNDRRNMDSADITWTATAGNPISAVVFCYVPDNTAPSDATTIPLTKHDCVMTPDGTDFTLTVADWARSS